MNKNNTKQENQYNEYYSKAQNDNNIVPNVKGMPAMDAIALLENRGLKVKLKGNGVGIVKSQSVSSSKFIVRNSVV